METKIWPYSFGVMNPWAPTPFEITSVPLGPGWPLADPRATSPKLSGCSAPTCPSPAVGETSHFTSLKRRRSPATDHILFPPLCLTLSPCPLLISWRKPCPHPQGSSETLSSLRISNCLLLASPPDLQLSSSICYLRKWLFLTLALHSLYIIRVTESNFIFWVSFLNSSICKNWYLLTFSLS